MAAEMSTGLLGMLAVQSAPESVAILITGMEAKFLKKERVELFHCSENPLFEGVAKFTTGEGVEVPVKASVHFKTVPLFRVFVHFHRKRKFPDLSGRILKSYIH